MLFFSFNTSPSKVSSFHNESHNFVNQKTYALIFKHCEYECYKG